jgi:hypothetical protein
MVTSVIASANACWAAAYDLVAGDDVHRIGLEPSINKRGGSATPVKQFEGTAPDNQSLGFVCPMGRLIDNANRHAKPREFGSHRHSDWTGTNDQDGHIFWSVAEGWVLLVLPRKSDAFYAAPGSTIKVGGGLGTPEVTE